MLKSKVSMNIIISMFFALALAGQNLYAADHVCEGPVGSTRVEACLLSKQNEMLSKQADGLYKQVQDVYKKSESVEESQLLADTERAWRDYRDSVCAYEDVANSGTYGISWQRCNLRMLEERVQYLQELLSNLSGKDS